MEKNIKNIDSTELSAELSADLHMQNEISFKADEMILCKKCGRTSPPNRMQCFYCAENFDVSEIQTDSFKTNIRKLDSWENGFNLIYLPDQKIVNETEVREITILLNLEKEFFKKLLKNSELLPIVRLESNFEAEIIKEKLSGKGIETSVISDEKLNLKTPVKRLRKIDFEAEKLKLTLFNTSELVEVSREDLILVVSGSIFEKKMEIVEKYIKSKENKTLSIDETAKDEKIIDIYSKNDSIGFRILTSGFDFSSLGDEMSFLAFENIIKIFEKLKVFAPTAKYAENYNFIRNLLGEVWEVEEVKDSGGFSKKGVGNINLNKTTIITNLTQFTKYSRLQRHFLEKNDEKI